MSKRSKKKLQTITTEQVNKNLDSQVKSYTAPRPKTSVSLKRVPLTTIRPDPIKQKREKVADALTKSVTKDKKHQLIQLDRFYRLQQLKKQAAVESQNKKNVLKKLHAIKTVEAQIQARENRFQSQRELNDRIEACSKRRERKNIMAQLVRKSGFGAAKMKKLFKNMKNAKKVC